MLNLIKLFFIFYCGSILGANTNLNFNFFSIPEDCLVQIFYESGPVARNNFLLTSKEGKRLIEKFRRPKTAGGLGWTDTLPIIHFSEEEFVLSYNFDSISLGEKLYLAKPGYFTVDIINTKDFSLIKTIKFELGVAPRKLIQSGKFLYIISKSAIYLLNTQTDIITDNLKIPLGERPSALLINRYLYLTGTDAKGIFILNTKDNILEKIEDSTQLMANCETMVNIGDFIYINSYRHFAGSKLGYLDSKIRVFNINNKTKVKDINMSNNFTDIFAMNNKLYIYTVQEERLHKVFILDPKTNSIINTIEDIVPSCFRLPVGSRLYFISCGYQNHCPSWGYDENSKEKTIKLWSNKNVSIIDSITDSKDDDFICFNTMRSAILLGDYLFIYDYLRTIVVIDIRDHSKVKEIKLNKPQPPWAKNINYVIFADSKLLVFSYNKYFEAIDLAGFLK